MKEEGRIIVITGFMGAGKTLIARALARRMETPVVDLDEHIVTREKRTIQAIIEERGEDYFRQVETHALSEVLDRKAARIIALGGGTWTLAPNRALLKQKRGALTIWLDAPFEICWRRIVGDNASRPLAPDEESARRLYEARREIYALADLHIKAEKSVREIVAEIIDVEKRMTTKENLSEEN